MSRYRRAGRTRSLAAFTAGFGTKVGAQRTTYRFD
jgi:hypothetical protein